jgi:hypothetical protein
MKSGTHRNRCDAGVKYHDNMPRETPAMLADEIGATEGPWKLSNARFLPTAQKENAPLGPSIAMAERNPRSEVALGGGPAAARAAAASLERSGYEILSIRSLPFQARRTLNGSRELDAEIRRLEALAADASTLASFPPRKPRAPGLPERTGPFAKRLFQRIRQRHAWSLQYVSVCRKGPSQLVRAPGWTTGAWCWALEDGEVRRLEMSIQVFSTSSSRNVDTDELARLTRGFRAELGSVGYKATKINWVKQRPQFALFEKSLATLATARRERRLLDAVLFGD